MEFRPLTERSSDIKPPYLAIPTPTPSTTSTPNLAQDILAAESYLQRGNNYVEQGDYQKAIEQYDEAIRLDLQAADAYNNRDIAYQAIGKSEEAARDLAKAEELGIGAP